MQNQQRRTPREWIELVEDQELSGQTIAEFCEENDIKQATFMYWRKKVVNHPQPESAQTGFVKLKLGKVKQGDRIILRGTGGIEIDLPVRFPVASLKALIKQISC